MNISSGMDDGPNPTFPYFPDAKFSDFPYGPGGGPGQGFHDFFPGQQPHFPPAAGRQMRKQRINILLIFINLMQTH